MSDLQKLQFSELTLASFLSFAYSLALQKGEDNGQVRSW